MQIGRWRGQYRHMTTTFGLDADPFGLRLLVLAPYSARDAAPTSSGSESSSTPIHDQAPLSPCIFFVAPSTDSSRSSWPSCARCVMEPVVTASKNIAFAVAT